MSKKAAELQAERGRKVSVKKSGSKLGKGEAKGSVSVPSKLIFTDINGGPSSVTPKLKKHMLQDPRGYADDEVLLLSLFIPYVNNQVCSSR